MIATLTDRQSIILNLLVGEYIHSAVPVASETIAKNFPKGVSAATVRNEMAYLEDEGYISRPHSSSGGLPLDKAYRTYVESLPSGIEPSLDIQAEVRQYLNQVGMDVEAWSSGAASILARMVHNLTISTYPKATLSRLKHLQVVNLQEFVSLLVLVFQEAKLRQRLIPHSEPQSPDDLAYVANKLTHHLSGLTRQEIEERHLELSPFEGELVQTALDVMKEEDADTHRDYYVEGLRHLLTQPEFTGGERTGDVLEVLETKTYTRTIMEAEPFEGLVKVVIGEENPNHQLRPFGIVMCEYGVPGEAGGVVGVIGPTRMEYHRTMSTVRYIASLMSKLVETIHHS